MSTVAGSRRFADCRRLGGYRLPGGQVTLALAAVWLLSAAFYVWTAATSAPLSLHAGPQDRYNLLASALLHFHLAVGNAPAGLTHLSNPYNPDLNARFLGGKTDSSTLIDDVLYRGKLYFIWGPAPALVLLVPLHLLGFEPSASATVAAFSIAGLASALGVLRVLIRQLGEVPTWMCVLAGLALSLGTVIPFLLRTPGVTEDVLAGGYCFAMAGIWLATAAIVDHRASVPRLLLMSLCFGLAAGSRPALGFCALVLAPVYLELRRTRSRRSLAAALGLPVAVCLVLLLAYNQARFQQPLEIGTRYQLTGNDSRDAPEGRLSYALPGTWLYVGTLPQPVVVFPFIALKPPKTRSPQGLSSSEITGGLLPMLPIVAFGAALPWLWYRRRALLGGLAVPLMALSGAGVAMMLLDAYEFFASTERYEVDFATLFTLSGIAAWLALSKGRPSRRRLLLRAGGTLLIVWCCVLGIAASFLGYGNNLAVRHPHTWRALEDAGAPLSTAIDSIIGHPVLAANFERVSTGVNELELAPAARETLTIVSPGVRTAALILAGELLPGTRYQLGVEASGSPAGIYPVPHGGETVELPLRLHRGLNHVTLFPVALSSAERAVRRAVIRIDIRSLQSRD
jgi:hypothetical protein